MSVSDAFAFLCRCQVDYVARACRGHQVGPEAQYEFGLSPLPFGGVQACPG